MSGVRGRQDLFLEQYYFARGGVQQQMDGMGGFYSTSNVGSNTNWIGSLNTYISLPVKPNVFGLFLNQGLFPKGQTMEYMFNTGLALKVGEVFGVYFPLYRSSNMGNLFNGGYADEIRFTIQFNIVENGRNLGDFIN